MAKETKQQERQPGSPAPDNGRFSFVFQHLRAYRHYLILGCISIVLAAIFSVVRPYIIKILLDDLEAGTLENYGLSLALAFVGLTALSGIFLFINRRTVIWMSRKLEYNIRGDLFAKLLRLPLEFYHQHRVGDIMARLTNDVEAVRMMFGPAIMYFANTLMTLTLAIAIMTYMAPKLTLYVIAPMPVISYFVLRVRRQINERFGAIQEQFSTLTAAVQENLSGIRVIKAYSQEPAEIKAFAATGREYVNRNMDLARFNALFHPLLFSVGGAISLIALYFGGKEVIAGTMTKGTVVGFFVYIAMLFWPIIAMGWVVSLYERGKASLDRINNVMHMVSEWDDDRDAIGARSEPLKGKIEFRNLSFSYSQTREGERPQQLENISLTIEPGESIGIIGPVGSGKSTLAALIPRLYTPPRGTLFIDDRDVCDWSLTALRTQIGYVPQESFLFSDRLNANIRFGVDRAGDELVRQAAELAALDKDVQEFREGYQTIVGERGITLSGGQKQRMSIARAILIDPKIIIFDDATSALDTETDAQIKSGLHEQLQGRTSIIISHRISSIQNCDRVYYIDRGKIIESGTHNALTQSGGPYAELNRLQSLEHELEEA